MVTIVNDANEKFKDMQDEICGFLFDFLRKINELEAGTYRKSAKLREEKIKRGIPEHHDTPEEKAVWDEYKPKMHELVAPYITEKLRKKGCAGSFGDPPTYYFIDKDITANFIMKSANRAVVIAHVNDVLKSTRKFVIKNVEGKWLVDEVYKGYEHKPDKWESRPIQ